MGSRPKSLEKRLFSVVVVAWPTRSGTGRAASCRAPWALRAAVTRAGASPTDGVSGQSAPTVPAARTVRVNTGAARRASHLRHRGLIRLGVASVSIMSGLANMHLFASHEL